MILTPPSLSLIAFNLEDPSTGSPRTMSWPEDWLDGKAAAGLAESTLGKYSADLKVMGLDIPSCSVLEIRTRLAECSRHYSRAVLRHLAIITKQVLKDTGRESDAKLIPLPKRPEPRIIVYSQQDLQEIMETCRTLRDRLLIQILIETGARRGELWNMKIRDVQFDQYSALIWLHGKTGTRLRRVYGALPQILEYLQNHPQKRNPEAKFWINQYGAPLSYGGFWRAVHRIGLRALNRSIYPHGFRHTAATRDVKSYTDREMMIRYGWNRPDMVAVYAHLTGRDVDEKDLALHGFRQDNYKELGNQLPASRILQDVSGPKVVTTE
jgi:integrase